MQETDIYSSYKRRSVRHFATEQAMISSLLTLLNASFQREDAGKERLPINIVAVDTAVDAINS